MMRKNGERERERERPTHKQTVNHRRTEIAGETIITNSKGEAWSHIN